MSRKKRHYGAPRSHHVQEVQPSRVVWMVACPSCGAQVQGEVEANTGGCLGCGRVWHIKDLPQQPVYLRYFYSIPLRGRPAKLRSGGQPPGGAAPERRARS